MRYLVALIAATFVFAGCAIGAVAPDLSQAIFKGSRFGQCPDGSIIEQKIYDLDPNDPEAAAAIFLKGDKPLAMINFKTKMVYVYSEKKLYTLEAVQEKYPTPCNIPGGTDV